MSNSDAEAKGIATAQAWQDAFNAQDHERQAEQTNFPHVRLANGRFATTESSEVFIENGRANKPKLLAEGWHHTVSKSMDVVQSGDDKVHIAIYNQRCREDGTAYKSFDTFWIVTLQDGHWGVKFRSSYLR